MNLQGAGLGAGRRRQAAPPPGAGASQPGDDLFAQGRFAEAFPIYEQAAAAAPESAPALARPAVEPYMAAKGDPFGDNDQQMLKYAKIASGNTNAPTIMIAEKGADMVLADAKEAVGA